MGHFPGQQQAHSGLDLPGNDGDALVEMCQAGSLTHGALENIVHKGFHDAHCFGGNASVGVKLLHHFAGADGLTFLPRHSPLLPPLTGNFLKVFSAPSLEMLSPPQEFSISISGTEISRSASEL